jgi:hypothetical protein
MGGDTRDATSLGGLSEALATRGMQAVEDDDSQAWATLEVRQNAIDVFREKRAERAALAAAEGPFLMLSW